MISYEQDQRHFSQIQPYCPNSPINFLQLSKLDSLVGAGDILDISLNQALGTGRISKADFASSKLNKVRKKFSKVKHFSLNVFFQVTQLTGFSDPVYAEAYVNVNQYDIVLDVLIVNQTRDTLQACTLELATLGDPKLVEKPQVFNQQCSRLKYIYTCSSR